QEGAAPDEITPPKRLDSYVWNYRKWLTTLSQASPSRIPPLSYHYRPWWIRLPIIMSIGPMMCIALLLGIGGLILAAANQNLITAAISIGLIVVGAITWRFLNRVLRPIGAGLEGCRTFRDLAYALAGQAPRRRIKTSLSFTD
ncbi:MAG TPA: hypothetical protein VGL71_03700, partial [Urbifossiella sp.]